MVIRAAAVLLSALLSTTAWAAPLRNTLLNKPAPAFTRLSISNERLDLANLRGKVVLLNFWATWCAPCQIEMPRFEQWQDQYKKDGLAIVGVSMDDDGWKAVTPFIKSAGVPYQIVLGDEKTAKGYHIEGMPDTFLIDGEGRIAAIYKGMVDREDIEKNVQSLLRSMQ